MLVDPATTPQRATRALLPSKCNSPLDEAIRFAAKRPSPLNESVKAMSDSTEAAAALGKLERALPRGGRSREIAVRSDWRHFDAEIKVSPQSVDAELWELLPEVKPHKGKPFVWRFVPSTSGQVKMYVLIKINSVELLKLRVGNAQASEMMASKSEFDEDGPEPPKASAVPQCDTPTRMRRAAKEQALARIGALRTAREQQPSLVHDAAWAAQQGMRKLAAAKLQHRQPQQPLSPQQQEEQTPGKDEKIPARRRPSCKPQEHEPMNGTTGIFIPVDVERWRESAVATFLDQTMHRQEAEEAATRVGIHMAPPPGAGRSESKVAGWGAIRFGRRKGGPVEAATSELHDPAAGPAPVLPPMPPMTPKNSRMLSSAI